MNPGPPAPEASIVPLGYRGRCRYLFLQCLIWFSYSYVPETNQDWAMGINIFDQGCNENSEVTRTHSHSPDYRTLKSVAQNGHFLLDCYIQKHHCRSWEICLYYQRVEFVRYGYVSIHTFVLKHCRLKGLIITKYTDCKSGILPSKSYLFVSGIPTVSVS